MVEYLKKLEKNKKYWLVLWWGAARWIFHVGVLKRIEELDIEITEVSGTSMWSLIWACVSIWLKYKDIYKIAKEVKYTSLIDVSIWNGIIKWNKLIKLLKEIFWNKKIWDTNIPLKIVAVDINNWEKYVFWSNDTIVDAVRSSVSVPWVFAPHKYKWKYYIDWWVVDNLPLDDTISENLIVSSPIKWVLDDIIKNKEKWLSSLWPIKSIVNSKKILQRTFAIMIRQINNYNLQFLDKKILFIDFPDNSIEYYDFQKRKKSIDAWYERAKRILIY